MIAVLTGTVDVSVGSPSGPRQRINGGFCIAATTLRVCRATAMDSISARARG